MNNLCRISYHGPGAALAVTLTEASIRTQCDLTTYEAEHTDEIPFLRHQLVLKLVMRASFLYDAVQELTSTSPEVLTMYAKSVHGKPHFALSSSGTLGSARVEFNNQAKPSSSSSAAAAAATEDQTNLFETFQLSDTDTVLKSSYKFSLIQKAARAMAVASKVSIRMDAQGVLSLQFMVEVDAGGGVGAASGTGGTMGTGLDSKKVSFVDFRFVPQVEDEDEDEAEGAEADETMMLRGASHVGEDEVML
jgi:cell cycle checkpoint protein